MRLETLKQQLFFLISKILIHVDGVIKMKYQQKQVFTKKKTLKNHRTVHLAKWKLYS